MRFREPIIVWMLERKLFMDGFGVNRKLSVMPLTCRDSEGYVVILSAFW